MIVRALHALARGLDAAGDYIEHAAAPLPATIERAQAASSLQPRYEAQYEGVLHAETDGDAWAFLRRHDRQATSLAGITPTAGTTLAVVDLEHAARVLRDHAPIINRPGGPISGCSCHGIRWGDAWSEHAVAELFDHLPTVQGSTDEPPTSWFGEDGQPLEDQRPPAGWLRRPSLEDTDPHVIEALRELGDRYGPLGVAIVAAALTDPNVLVAHLRTRAHTRVVPQYADEPEGEKTPDTDDPAADEVPMPDGGPCPICGRQVARVLLDGHLQRHRMNGEDEQQGPRPGWSWVQAGQATEFIGRTVVLPINRPDVPRGEQVMASARWSADFDPIPNVVMVKLEGLELEYALAREDRMQVKNQ